MKKITLFIVGLVITSLAISQNASPVLVSSAGDSYSNSSYQLAWSIGECVTATHSAGDFVITQGFHQDSYTITKINDFAADINISVYPNPTTALITMDFSMSVGLENAKITVTDINGKVLQQKKVSSDKEQFDFSAFANGTYFLSVKQNNQSIKIFKIIKN